ncbi:MAG: hypothetical protein ACM3N5_12845, partial [Candidatus Eiseniibacteriota bacterium]
NPDRNHHQNYKAAIGYGITDFWRAEVEGEFNKEPGRKLNYETTGIENIVRVLPEGKYWLDLGLFSEYEIAADKGDPDELHFGPIAQTTVGPLLVTVNPFFAHEIGSHASASMEFEYGVQARYRWLESFEPGIEAFGRPGEIRGFGRVSDQEHKIGPTAYGRFGFGRAGALKYEAGVLFGVTHGAPAETVKWLLEYEFFL